VCSLPASLPSAPIITLLPPPLSPPVSPTPIQAPLLLRTAEATTDCYSDTKSFLYSDALEDTAPNVNYHGPTFIYSTSGPFTGTAANITVSLNDTTWYPGRAYSISIDCGAPCSVLVTVEDSAAAYATASSGLYGTFLPGENMTVGGTQALKTAIAAGTLPGDLPSSYTAEWIALPLPSQGAAHIYYSMDFRISVVYDTGSASDCPLVQFKGLFQLAPNITCGSGKQNVYQSCDDGNTASGDGCSSACQLEVREGLKATAAGQGLSTLFAFLFHSFLFLSFVLCFSSLVALPVLFSLSLTSVSHI
jgi:cysteine-rich repeat protein